MRLEIDICTADEYRAASTFMAALADLRQGLEAKFAEGEYKLPETLDPVKDEPADALQAALADARAPAPNVEPVKRTRKKKEPEASPAPSTEMVVSEPEQPEPSDPAAGWTIDDARQAARTMLGRAPTSEAGNAAFRALLESYGVARIGDLAADAYESFVTDTMQESF